MPAVFLERQMTLTKGELPEPVVLQALPHVTVTAQYVDSAGKPSSGHSQSLTGKLGDQYWWGRGSPDAGGKMVILAPRGLAEAKLNLVNNEHGAYRAQRDKDSPLESTRDLRLGTLTEDVPGILIHRYKAPMVVARVLAKDGGELKNVEVTGLYAGHDDPNAYRPYFESDASDGRIRTSQMLPDEELTITATADGYGPRTKKLKLPEGEILETEFVLAKE